MAGSGAAEHERDRILRMVAGDPVWISYVNHEGKHGIRKITPLELFYASQGTLHHMGQQGWYLKAFAHDRGQIREFQMTSVLGWYDAEPVGKRTYDVLLFARAVLHGDDVHREWLLEAARAWVEGKPIPEARDGRGEFISTGK